MLVFQAIANSLYGFDSTTSKRRKRSVLNTALDTYQTLTGTVCPTKVFCMIYCIYIPLHIFIF